MSVLRNDQNLSTADIVNAENSAQSNSQRNSQPQQSVAVAERERVQDTASADKEFPDLADKTDPRFASVVAAEAQERHTVESPADRDHNSDLGSARARDVRPVQPLAAFGSQPAGDKTAASSNESKELSSGPLFPEDELRNFRAQWDKVQVSFVDEPRQAVQQADSLVANVVKRIAEQFAEERARLEQQWDRGGDVSTEDLRQGLRRYRAFFDRLLSF